MKYSELIRLLNRDGWLITRQTGSHMFMEHLLKQEKLFALTMVQKKWARGWKKRLKNWQV